MSLIFNLLFVSLFCAVFGAEIHIPSELKRHTLPEAEVKKDTPLNVSVLTIGDRYIVFNISGNDTINGQPITQLFVNYTIEGPATEVKTVPISASASNGRFNHVVKVVDLMPGIKYQLQFAAENAMKQRGPLSTSVFALTLPPTPDITVLHPSLQRLKVIWGEKRSKDEDYYLLTVEKKSALGCGLTVNLTSCFGKSYTLDDLEVGEVYKLTMKAHNPSGFSEPVVVSYPIE